MKSMITGANGTLGRVLFRILEKRGDEVVPFDRKAVSPFEEREIEAYLRSVSPDRIFHLAVASRPTGVENEGYKINVEWPMFMAKAAGSVGSKMVFSSSVMVYEGMEGPFTPQTRPDCHGGYGYHKFLAEQKLLSISKEVHIARLGWQIGESPQGNHMLSHLLSLQKEKGLVEASSKWLPACSFLSDTAETLIALSERESGIYLIDSNLRRSYYEIASALNKKYSLKLNLKQTEDFIFDQRMQDERVKIPSLEERLPELFG